MLGPVEGFYFQLGNGAEGVLIQSTSNVIGDGAGNVISANQGYGVHVEGIDATRNLIESNYIGAAPGGGYPLAVAIPATAATASLSTTRPITKLAVDRPAMAM